MEYGRQALERPATRADLEPLPETVVGEIIDGVLYVFPRPRARHSDILTMIAASLKFPFQLGRDGPGGWWILAEPGIELPGSPEVVPDVAGWRRERMPSLPEADPLRVPPDWVCEIFSPTTRAYDLRVKRPFYASVGVRHLWYVDLETRTLTISELIGRRWTELGIHLEDEVVRAPPFEQAQLRLAEWWAGAVPPAVHEPGPEYLGKVRPPRS